MLNELALFAGIGGISHGLREWTRPICYVEADPDCVERLAVRIRSGELPIAPIWGDIRRFDPAPWIGAVDIITAGFPCQDISAAGADRGLEGERSGLFFQVVRLAAALQPGFLFLENVPPIRRRGLDRVVRELARIGYDPRWDTVSAADVGAGHLRKRWWSLAAHSSIVGRGPGPDDR